ncbi:MAG TPA: radical SAM family heme chaperone HemW [Syntrophales bacterium]|nr:radical SAM family heme chaperone HemW [Syntrophales bacterium]
MENINSHLPGLYIHIPFCRSKCPYCSFFSVTSLTEKSDFFKALFREMDMYRDIFNRFDTIYIGGGTPSVLTVNEVEELLTRVRRCFTIGEDAEITMEVNPGDIELNFLKALSLMGINRLNIGVQSLNEDILRFLGRRHSVAQGIATIETAKKEGFRNIGIDLVYAIPGQDMKSWMNTVEQVKSFAVEHLSCYQLSVDSGTDLENRQAAGEFDMPDEDMQIEFFLNTSFILESAGYIHYEVSNFAKGMALASRHNQKYWDQSPFLGLGPAAHSFQEDRRWWNHYSIERYVQDTKEGRAPVQLSETLSPEQLCLEALFLGLRTKKGIRMEDFSRKYTFYNWAERKDILTKLEEDGFVEIADGYLKPTRKGLAVADSLALI